MSGLRGFDLLWRYILRHDPVICLVLEMKKPDLRTVSQGDAAHRHTGRSFRHSLLPEHHPPWEWPPQLLPAGTQVVEQQGQCGS